MHDSKGRDRNLLSRLMRVARESVQSEAVHFRNSPPWWEKGSLSRPCGEGRCGRGGGGVAMYITQNGGRGAIAPISTLIVCSRSRVS